MIRIGLAQINTTVGDIQGNVAKIIRVIAEARDKGVDIIAFPEMAVCGYPPEDLLYKSHFIDQNKKAVKVLEKYSKDIVVIVGYVDTDAQKNRYNAAAVLNKGKISGVYRKESLPNYGVFDEKRYFCSGGHNPLFRLGNMRFAVNICEDIWDDNGPHRWQADAHVDMMINISSSPYDFGKGDARRRLFSRRAKQAKAFFCYANLVGGQDEIVFDGASCVFDPKGRRAACADLFEEDLLVFDMDEPGSKKRQLKQEILLERPLRQQVFVLEKRKEKFLEKTACIYQALVLGTRDYIQKNGFNKAVIGLSGGVDSALVAQIAVDALGKDRVVGVTMPSQYTSEGTHADARLLAENLGIDFMEVPIKPIFDTYLESLKDCFHGQARDITEENIQARIRGNVLMALSNKYGWIVLTTGNKSEMAVGYCTLYGDMSGGFAVIKDVYKTTVYDLARYCNNKAGQAVIPQSIIDRAPSAELRENQKDQDSLPPYDVLDQILIAYIEKQRSFKEIVEKVSDEDLVKKVLLLVDKSEYKRRQAPPGVKITSRAFGKDWRLPITNRYKQY